MLSYIQPNKHGRDTAVRLHTAFGLLLASKGLNVTVPFMFKCVLESFTILATQPPP